MNRRLFRWWWLALILPLAVGLARLRFDVEVLNLLPDELPVVHGLKLYQAHFTSVRELIITLRGPDAAMAEVAARRLAESLRGETNLVAGAVWQSPLQEHPDQTAELLAYLWLNQPPEVFAQLANRLAPGKLDHVLRETRDLLSTTLSPPDLARLSYDPFGFTRLPETGLDGGTAFDPQPDEFASADGAFRAVFVEARGELPNYRACAGWFGEIKAVVNRCQHSAGWPGNVTVRFTGAPAFVAEIATGMERDIKGSVLCALMLIAGLFWWAHRSWRPLLWLLAFLGLIVAGTLAMGGLLFGTLNAVSLGFAAILLGLAVDYGLVLYQEWVAAPQLSAQELRRIHTPGIAWSAVTTATAFALLNFAGLPGLSQLGSLVAIGVLLAAIVMLHGFLPVVLRNRSQKPNPRVNRKSQIVNSFPTGSPTFALIATGTVAVLAALILWRAWPPVDHSTSPLQPRHYSPQIALDEMQTELNQHDEPLLVVISGRDEDEVARRLDAVRARFSQAAARHEARGVRLPTALWPQAENQRVNLVAANALAAQANAMKGAAAEAGFTSEAMTLAENIFRAWQQTAGVKCVIWPTNESGQWLLKRVVARESDRWLVAGAVYPGTNGPTAATAATLDPKIPGVWLTAWPLLGDVLLQHVEHRLRWVVTAMIAMIIVCLWVVFRRWTEVGLSFATLGFSLLVLLAVMRLVGWSWNLMNLMAVPILLGAGVDYTIHIQLALRRHGGDMATVRRVTGRAVFLCATTTVAGFGSNAFSSNAGLASLGLVCAMGIAAVYLTAICLLPAWWQMTRGRKSEESSTLERSATAASREPRPANLVVPSATYRANVWRFGLVAVRLLPECVCRWVGMVAAAFYRRMCPRRSEVVAENLLPVLAGDRVAAERATRALFQEFAIKIVDLWRYESGTEVQRQNAEWHGWETFTAAQARGKGVLIVTPHLGNWEFGASFFVCHGIPLLVLTQPEPEARLTELRQAARARHGIETLVVGEDAFAFVEIIKRLQAGATVALLVDRPPAATAVTVELFGRPFQASIAPAELARASGCAIVPAIVVRNETGYTADILPEIHYERAAIGDRAARVKLTQEILRALEPVIRQHVDQWYHFVPVWPTKEKLQASTLMNREQASKLG